MPNNFLSSVYCLHFNSCRNCSRTHQDTSYQARAPPPHHPKFTSIIHHWFGSDYGTSTIHRQHQTIPHHQVIVPTSILVEIARELTKTHPIKLEPSPTPPKIHIDQTSKFRKRLRRLCHPPTTPNDPPSSSFCQHSNYQENCLRTCKDTPTQARAFPHTSQNSPQLNRSFGSNHGAAAATRQYTTILYNQAIDSTPICFVEIA